MGIKVTFEFDTAEEAAGFLLNQCANPLAAVAQKVPQAQGPKAPGILGAGPFPPIVEQIEPAPKKRVVKKAAAAEEKPQPAPAPLPEATQEDAQKAVERLFEARGMPTCKAVMSEYGVNRVRDMKPEHYAKFVAHADKVLAGGEV